jgi:hypothetical protein
VLNLYTHIATCNRQMLRWRVHHFGLGWSCRRAGVKPRAITPRHGLERVLARGATIAAHLIGAAADRKHSAYRAVTTAEQEVKCASDESFHFSEFKKLFLNSSWRNIL